MWTAFTLDFNCYFKSSQDKSVILWRGGAAAGGGDYLIGDLKSYQEKSGKELHIIFANPMLSPSSELRSGSPAIDAGIDVGYQLSGAAPEWELLNIILVGKTYRSNK